MDTADITISFDDIFGKNPDDVSLNKLESFLDRVISDTFQQTAHNPNELVRVVDRGVIRWMTAEEAEAFLEAGESETDQHLKRSIQDSLRGDSRILDQEIKVLLILATNTLKQYRDHKLIPESEIERTEPNLIRLSRQVNFQLNKLWEIDNRIKDLREQNPILSEFEQKMGELLNLQKSGAHEKAALIANELAGMKHKYVRLSRGLKSDSDAAIHMRLELQRQKKSILSSHRYLVAQREGVLQEEAQDLRQNIENLQALLRRSEEDKKTNFVLALEDKSGQLTTKELEIQIVQKEQSVLKKKEDETDTIINHMEKSVTPTAPPPGEPAPRHETPQSQHEEEPEEKKRIRMATAERRQQR